MIVTCPECSVRFLLASNVLGEEGHNVRCSSCGHVWHQMPEDEFAEEEHEEEHEREQAEDIPEGEKAEEAAPESDDLDKDDFGAVMDALSKPDSNEGESEGEQGEGEGDTYPDVPQSLRMHRAPPPGVKKKASQESAFMAPPVMAGYGAALLVFLLIFGALYIAKDAVFRAYPASAVLYSMIGVEFAVPGEGLVFDSVQVTHSTQNGKIAIEGTVINLTPESQNVPLIEAALVDDKNRAVERWYIETPFENIEGEGAEFFNVHYAPVTQNDTQSLSLSLRFVLKQRDMASVKSASANDGSNPALHAGG